MAEQFFERAQAFYNDGMAKLDSREIWEARECFEKALDCYAKVPDTEKQQAYCLLNLGTVFSYPEIGELEEAERLYREGLKLLDKIPRADADRAVCISCIGRVLFEQGRLDEAKLLYEEALSILTLISSTDVDPRNSSSCYLYYGYTLIELGLHDDAAMQFDRAFSIFEECGAPFEVFADILVTVGRKLKRAGFIDASRRYFEKARAIFKKMPVTKKSEFMIARCEQELDENFVEGGGIVESYEGAHLAKKYYLDAIASYADALMKGDYPHLRAITLRRESPPKKGKVIKIVAFEYLGATEHCIAGGIDEAKIYFRDAMLLFSEAIKRRDYEFLKSAAIRNGWINAWNHKGQTPLHVACYEGFPELVGVLIAHGADLNARDRNGFMPLHLAAHQGHTTVIRVLLAAGALVNARDNGNRTPLHWAMQKGHRAAADVLREYIVKDL